MFRELGYFSMFLASAMASSCNTGGRQQMCGYTKFVMDVSSYMRTNESVQEEFNFIANRLLPQYDPKYGYCLEIYGGISPTYKWCDGNGTSCDCLSTISQMIASNNLGSLSLTSLLREHYGDPSATSLTIFTATTNQSDINSAVQYVRANNKNITLVNMAPGMNYTAWPITKVITHSLPFPQGFELDIINLQCGRPVTSTTTTSPTTTTTIAPTTTTPAPPVCPCISASIWNDVIVLFDGSNRLSKQQFGEMTSLVQAALDQLSIGQALQFNTRVGAFVYAELVANIANLTNYKSNDDMLAEKYIQLNNDYTNIDAALFSALSHFEESAHRTNARKVIVLSASGYREGNYDSPIPAADLFKADGGIIIVIEYAPDSGSSPVLQQIASPGYYIKASSAVSFNFTSFVQLQCNANCFCPKPYTPVTNNGQPTGGCYFVSDLPTVDALAKRNCLMETGGQLAMPKSSDQKVLVAGQANKDSVFVGMEKVSGTWTWADGTTVTDPVVASGTGTCASFKKTGAGFGTQFTQTDCHSAIKYSCQTAPCTSTNYCPPTN